MSVGVCSIVHFYYFCSERRSVFKELDELISSESNFQTFRDVLDKVITPNELN